MQFEIRHALARPPEVAFSILTSPAFQAEVEARVRVERTLIEDRRDADVWTRAWRIVDRSEAPAFVQRLIGSSFVYTLEQRTVFASRLTRWRVTPSVGAERVRAFGEERIEAGDAPGRSVRVVSGLVEVDAPLVGRRLSEFIGGEVHRGYERSVAFVQRYVDEHP